MPQGAVIPDAQWQIGQGWELVARQPANLLDLAEAEYNLGLVCEADALRVSHSFRDALLFSRCHIFLPILSEANKERTIWAGRGPILNINCSKQDRRGSPWAHTVSARSYGPYGHSGSLVPMY